MTKANIPWSTSYPDAQDTDTVEQPDLTNDSYPGAEDGHRFIVEHLHALRDKLQSACLKVGTTAGDPGTSLEARVAVIEGGGYTTDEKVSISGTDTTPGFLGTKLTGASGILATVQDDPGDASIALTPDYGTASGKVCQGNDGRLPLTTEKNALAGTTGTPDTGNEYVTDSDTRMTDARTPTLHAIAGSEHDSSSLASLNNKISDATLDTSSASRPPSGSASGQLGGSYPEPDVRGIRETDGPTLLTIGAVADGEYLTRSGSTLVGAELAGGGTGDYAGTFRGNPVNTAAWVGDLLPTAGGNLLGSSGAKWGTGNFADINTDGFYCSAAISIVGMITTNDVNMNTHNINSCGTIGCTAITCTSLNMSSGDISACDNLYVNTVGSNGSNVNISSAGGNVNIESITVNGSSISTSAGSITIASADAITLQTSAPYTNGLFKVNTGTAIRPVYWSNFVTGHTDKYVLYLEGA